MFLDKLKEIPKRIQLVSTFLIGFILFLVINLIIFQPLIITVPGYTILDYEFAWNPEQVIIIFATWGPNGMTQQAIGIYWDFLYIVGYVAFSFSGVLLVTRELTGRWQVIGLYISLITIFMGIFDVIENIFLLTMLLDPNFIISMIPALVGIMATLKFGALLIALIYFTIGLISLIYKKMSTRKRI